MMKISVIVAIYNASRYLRECLDSIVNQDFKGEYEVILVNDGSTDDSLSICQEYASQHTNVVVLTGENAGVSAARNKGIDVARGEWYFFADADDIMSPDALTTLYDRQKETQADLARANYVTLEDGVVSKPCLRLPNETLRKPICNIFGIGSAWGFLMPAKVIMSNKLRFVEGVGMGEDSLFCYQLACLCETIAFSNKVVYVYRIHRKSATHSENRVWFAKQHFVFAHHSLRMANFYKEKDGEVFGVLKSAGESSIVRGIAGFQRRFKVSEFGEMRRAYYEIFGDGFKQVVVFWMLFMRASYTNLKFIRNRLFGKKY